MLSGEATNTNFIVWLDPIRLEPTIYHTRGEPANYYTTDVVGSEYNCGTLGIYGNNKTYVIYNKILLIVIISNDFTIK
jgi:hypothetical protein